MPPPGTSHDVPLLIVSTASSSERRITPSWSIAHLKTKLEPVTGIPPSAQKLTLRLPDQEETSAVESVDEEVTQIGQWPLVPYAELQVESINPSAGVQIPTGDVPKQEMPIATYERLPDTVLDFKRKHQIGRFDPSNPEKQEQKVKEMWEDVKDRGIIVDGRCCLANEPTRRGTIRFIGAIPSLPGLHSAPWIGVALDEPFGKNDGSVNGERYFQCKEKYGVFVRPERVEAGDYPELGVEEEDPDMEEI